MLQGASLRAGRNSRSGPIYYAGFLTVIALAITTARAAAQVKTTGQATIVQAAGFAESLAVRDLPPISTKSAIAVEKEINEENRELIRHVDPRVKPSAYKAASSTLIFRS
jgi:hypothetical protein